ncbi:hypothetical protein [Pseudomonas putida]|uniref:hypothetical protein n=1 Tax=Pseudomonas putida TaxID=303 RepID=UPI002B24CC02|nr:hypothetical protein [Pseudomonas putida]
MRKLVCGWGVNDADYQIQVNRPHWAGDTKKYTTEFDCPYYRTWARMVERCHSGKFKLKNPAYLNATICDEWKHFTAFRAWMLEQPWQGNELDKDILGDGTHYSPQTCCFVPKSVNMFWTKCNTPGGGLVGVSFHKASGKFRAQCKIGSLNQALGYFDNELDAHRAWIRGKAKSMAMLLSKFSLEDRIIEGMHNKLKQFQARLAA